MPPKKKEPKEPKDLVNEEGIINDDDIINEELEEEFFNQNSYDSFTYRNKIEILSSNHYTNNDLHKEDAVVPKGHRITSEIMTHAEYTRVVSERAKQIENGSPIFIILKNEHDPIKISEKEIRQKRCPLKIMRYLTKNIKEEWSVNEMIIPFGINID
jgi:DNA-directed RNA polymerase subunit K/omega